MTTSRTYEVGQEVRVSLGAEVITLTVQDLNEDPTYAGDPKYYGLQDERLKGKSLMVAQGNPDYDFLAVERL
jgi:hypothetical protein